MLKHFLFSDCTSLSKEYNRKVNFQKTTCPHGFFSIGSSMTKKVVITYITQDWFILVIMISFLDLSCYNRLRYQIPSS